MSDTSPAAAISLPRISFVLIFATALTTTIGLTGMATVMPAIGRKFGIPDALVSMIFSLSGLMFSLCSPFWARVSDRRGRKPLMLLGLAGFIISMSACSAVVLAGMAAQFNWFALFVMLLFARGLFGLLASADMPATSAYVAEHTPPATRTRSIASLAGAGGLGSIIGPTVAPLLVMTPMGLAGPMIGFTGLAVVVWVLVWRFLPESRHMPAIPPKPKTAAERKAQKLAPLWRDPRFAPFLAFTACVWICAAVQAQTIGFLIIDKLDMDPVQAQRFIAIAMVCSALAGIVAQWGLVPLFNLTPRLLMRWGAGVAALGNLIVALQHSYLFVVVGCTVSALGFALCRPGYAAGSSLALKPHEQARAAGAIAALAGVNALTNPIFVWLYSQVNWAPFAICTVAMSALVVFAFANPMLASAVPPVQPKDVAPTQIEELKEGLVPGEG